VSGPPARWDIVIRVAVDAAAEAEARTVVDLVFDAMGVAPAGTPPFVQFDDGTWATEKHVNDPEFDQVEPNDALSVLSCLTADLGPVTFRGVTDSPLEPDSARVGQMEWPPSYWALAGRKETVVHPSVRAVLLQAHRSGFVPDAADG
jgi:hypothetical protein